uniref:Uncharacterized protein n=1 Tax=Neovison vison TaxID=452646 RepID=A0A8C7A6U1_NEOVI
VGQSSHPPLDILDPHPQSPAGWPPSLHLYVFFQKMRFWVRVERFSGRPSLNTPCFPDVEQGFAQGVESTPSHLSARPCYLTPAPAIAVTGPASSLARCWVRQLRGLGHCFLL